MRSENEFLHSFAFRFHAIGSTITNDYAFLLIGEYAIGLPASHSESEAR